MRYVLSLLVALVALFVARGALAAPALRFVEPGPRVLEPASGAWVATETVENAGDGTLVLSRVFVRDADVDRELARVHAGFAGGATHAELRAGERATVEVYWAPLKDEGTAVRGHVVVVTSDPRATEQAFGFRGERARGTSAAILRHLLLALLGVPALAALLLALGGFRRRDAAARMFALAAATLTAAIGWGVVRIAHPNLGHEALALGLRAVLVRGSGIELALGVDGASLPAIASVALLLPVGIMLTPRGAPIARAALLALAAMVLLALLSVDGAVTAVALAASVVLVAVIARAAAVERSAVRRFAVVSGVGVAAFVLATLLLRAHADTGYLVDGERAVAPWSATELARTAFLAKHVTLLGAPLVAVAWVLFFVAAATLGGLVPYHLGTVLRARPHVAFAVVALFLRLGPAILLRWAIPILPEATRWAAPVVVDLALAVAVVSALAALAAANPLRSAVAVGSAASFAAMAALTPQGFAAFALYGALGGVAATLALVTEGRFRAVALSLVALGGLSAGVLALVALGARAPAAAVGLGIALALVATANRAPRTSPPRPIAIAAALVLVVFAAGAVDVVAPSARALSERMVRVGGDLVGA